MADDLDVGTAEAAPEPKSMEQSMAEVYDAMQAEPEAPVSPAGEAGLPSAEPSGEQSRDVERPRGPDGKFIEKSTAVETPKEAAPAPKEITDQPAKTETEPTPSTAPAQPPVSWSGDAKQAWSSIPPAVQQAVLKREKEASDGIKSYADRLKAYEPFEQILGPRRAALRAQHGNEYAAIQKLFALSDYAGQNPAEFIHWFARQRGIPLEHLQQAAAQQATVDPQLAALQAKTAQLENYLRGQQMQAEQAQQAELNRVIEGFRADPKNAYFEEVRADMAALLQAGRAQDLQTAYDMAIHANPTTRARIMESQKAEAEKARQAEAQAKAANAKKIAASNVATKGTIGASPSAAKSFEETMSAVYDRIQGAA